MHKIAATAYNNKMGITAQSGLGDDLDILVFFVVLGVPYGLLRFVVLGSPIPFTALPKDKSLSGD